jgi:hypothetical protein
MKAESKDVAVAGGDVCLSYLCLDVRDVLRKSMNDVLPEFWAPMTRMLTGQRNSCRAGAYLNGVGSFLRRTRRGLLMPDALMALLA